MNGSSKENDVDLLSLCRHRAELPLYFFCVILNITVVCLVVISFFVAGNVNIAYYIAFLYLFVNLYISMGSTFSSTRLYSVEIGENQFSDIYEVACRYAKILNLKSVPKIYVKQNGGVINAFASYFLFRNYILINADIFEIAYLKNKDINAVSFVLAHEMSHIAYNHTKFWYNAGILISRYVPVFYSALSRAREYSCDNVAKMLCPEGVDGIFIVVLGKHLYKNINIDEYLNQAEKTHGWFLFYKNAVSSHPVPLFRISSLYGRMKPKLF